MSIKERSLGPLYAAHVKLNQERCPIHWVDVTEVNPPWRQGRAVVMPLWRFQALALGLWIRKSRRDISDEDGPAWATVLEYSPSEIADWDDGSG